MEEFIRQIAELLSKGNVEQAVASVYYAVRILRHIKQINSIKEGFIVKGLNTEPSPGDIDRARAILSLIEKTEQTSVEHLSKEKAEEYTQNLADLLLLLVQAQLRYDPSRGRDLLNECRRSDLYWRSK